MDNRVYVTKLLLNMRRHVKQVRKCYEQQYESLDRSYVSRDTEQAYEDVFHMLDSIEGNVEAVLGFQLLEVMQRVRVQLEV